MLDQALALDHPAAAVPLIPGDVEVFGCLAELDDEIARQVFRLDFAALLAPQVDERRLIVAHNNPRVRAADEALAVSLLPSLRRNLQHPRPLPHIDRRPCRELAGSRCDFAASRRSRPGPHGGCCAREEIVARCQSEIGLHGQELGRGGAAAARPSRSED